MKGKKSYCSHKLQNVFKRSSKQTFSTFNFPLTALKSASFGHLNTSIYTSCRVGKMPQFGYYVTIRVCLRLIRCSRSLPIVFPFFKAILIAVTFVFAFPLLLNAQQAAVSPTPTPTPLPSPTAAPQKSNAKIDPANYTAEQIVESTIVIYAFPGGRPVLDQIRKTTFERGKTTVMNGEGKLESANYSKWVIRGGSLDKEKIRLDQEFPSLRYSLVKNDERVFMIYNDSVFSPREDAAKAFQNQIFRGLDGLLRYKENESKIELAGKDKILGVELYKIDVTDKQGFRTRYYISTKRFRILALDYEIDGKKYQRKFYDYNYAQGTLVPYRTVLTMDGKVIEDTTIGTITFGQKVDDSLFTAS